MMLVVVTAVDKVKGVRFLTIYLHYRTVYESLYTNLIDALPVTVQFLIVTGGFLFLVINSGQGRSDSKAFTPILNRHSLRIDMIAVGKRTRDRGMHISVEDGDALVVARFDYRTGEVITGALAFSGPNVINLAFFECVGSKSLSGQTTGACGDGGSDIHYHVVLRGHDGKMATLRSVLMHVRRIALNAVFAHQRGVWKDCRYVERFVLIVRRDEGDRFVRSDIQSLENRCLYILRLYVTRGFVLCVRVDNFIVIVTHFPTKRVPHDGIIAHFKCLTQARSGVCHPHGGRFLRRESKRQLIVVMTVSAHQGYPERSTFCGTCEQGIRLG